MCQGMSKSRWPSFHKLFQIRLRRNRQHKFPCCIRHHRKVLLLSLLAIQPDITFKELLQLLQRCLHRDNLIRPPFPIKPLHGRGDRVRFAHGALLE